MTVPPSSSTFSYTGIRVKVVPVRSRMFLVMDETTGSPASLNMASLYLTEMAKRSTVFLLLPMTRAPFPLGCDRQPRGIRVFSARIISQGITIIRQKKAKGRFPGRLG